MTVKFSLCDFPNEILLEIFAHLKNKIPLKKTCRKFYQIVSELEVKQFRLVIKDVSLRFFTTFTLIHYNMLMLECEKLCEKHF
jgi:hypothetical protein